MRTKPVVRATVKEKIIKQIGVATMRISYSDYRLLEVCDGIIKINKNGISNSIFNSQSMDPDFRVLKLTEDYTTIEAKLQLSVDCVFWGR